MDSQSQKGAILDPEMASSNKLQPGSQLLGFLGGSGRASLRYVVCLFLGADLWLRPSQWLSAIQNPKKSWLATGILVAVC